MLRWLKLYLRAERMNVTGDLMDPRDAGPLHSERTQLDSDGSVFNGIQTAFGSTIVFRFVSCLSMSQGFHTTPWLNPMSRPWGAIRLSIRLSDAGSR